MVALSRDRVIFLYMLFGACPDIRRLENLMRAELQREALTAQIIAEAKQEAADRLRSVTPDPTEGHRR